MEKIHIVLASPSDLTEERKMIQDLISDLNPLYMKKDICVDLRMWENSVAGMNADGPQGLIDLDLEIPKADIFICLYWKKIGTIIEKENVAGTEHELNVALESYRKNRKPDIKTFFKKKELDSSTDDYKKIKEISNKLRDKGLYDTFMSLEELKNKINRVIQKEVMERLSKTSVVVPEIHKYIEISNTENFIASLCSNNKLVLNKGYYDLLDFSEEKENVYKEGVFDGKELVIENITNVTIVGDNSTLLVSPRYANVITFKNCTDIKLIGLTMGHTPYKGECSGAVLHLINCSNIQMESLTLYGCGTYGVFLSECKNIRMNGTKIFECSYGGMCLVDSEIIFENSQIFDCKKIFGSLVEAYASQLTFDNVSIFHNYTESNVFNLIDSSLFCNGVSVYSNSFGTLSNIDLPYGIYEEDNVVINNEKWNLTISKEDISKDDYFKIKEICIEYGKIDEAIYENGKMYLDILTVTDEKCYELQERLEGFPDLEFARG